MDLKLNELDYQKKAVDCIASIFEDNFFVTQEDEHQNPYIDFDDISVVNKLRQNIKLKNNLIENTKLHKEPLIDGICLNLDIKMETGTGKTYVYTKTIYELNKKFGIKKFIILVPSLAIKEGTRSFIENSRRYFNSELEYNNYLLLYEQSDGEFGSKSKDKKSASKFPKSVEDYFEKGFSNNISVLITNDDYLSDNSYGLSCENSVNDKILFGNNRCPKDVIAYTKPFIIIDEPHNFLDENKVMTFIREQLKPQCIIRFGATFPEIEIGKEKTKKTIVDYKNLIFDLSTKEAFNKDYIKQVSIYNTDEIDSPIKNIKFVNFKKGESITVEYKNGEKKEVMQIGDRLSFLGREYSKYKLKNVSKQSGKKGTAYINDIKINEYDSKIDNVYSASDFSESFQEGMIMVGLRRHFEKEKQNLNANHLIKTICLFFISDIDLYRDRDRKNETPLRDLFEKCLKKQIEDELKHIDKNNKYELLFEKYLKATLDNIDKNDDNMFKVHGGYFAGEANNKEDSEYDRIIKNKAKTLRLINEVGQIEIDENGDIILTKEDGTKTKNVTFNTFRFIFSKWTLKEGWDNPNVFTIVKLRTSKSNNRKMQELGRGLRIPVDIYMNRLNNGQFDLNYVIDNKEKDFAKVLISEIYGEEGIENGEILTEELLTKIAKKLNCDEDNAFDILRNEKIIDRNKNIINSEELISKYGDCIGTKLKKGAVKEGYNQKNDMVKIRKKNFEKIKDLWTLLNNRYYISINKEVFNEKENQKIIFDALNKIDDSHFKNIVLSNQTYTTKDNNSSIIAKDHFSIAYDKMKYNDFLIKISEKTLMPITSLNRAICEYANDNSVQSSKICEDFFNNNVCEKFIEFIEESKYDNLIEKFSYTKLNHNIKKTQLTDENGEPLKEIQANLVGIMGEGFVGVKSPDKYLYEEIRYDSEIEKEYIDNNANKEVVVYGKIPRRSIKIPKIDGHTTSPDFMYVIKENDNCKSINLVVETKGFNEQSDGSIKEKKDKEYQEKFFEQFKKDLEKQGIIFDYKYQLNNDDLNKVIDDLIKSK